ncbi:Receptor expression-enhancing protein 3, partial [Dissostichus eleginoides]
MGPALAAPWAQPCECSSVTLSALTGLHRGPSPSPGCTVGPALAAPWAQPQPFSVLGRFKFSSSSLPGKVASMIPVMVFKLLFFGTLYPAYYSYKAVKTKNVKEYVRWMMYWIVFALYTVVEAITDLTLAWFPLYYELKIAFVIWLLSPYTRGASLIYRKCLHPLLSSREREIDEYIVQAKERSYETMVNFGKQGLSIAATAAVSAAVKGQGAITEKLRSLSMHDLTQISQQDDRGDQLYQYSSRSSNPAIRRSQSTDAADGP